MLCAQITVIQNHKDPYDNDASSWNVWEQEAGDPWIMQTEVDLVVKNLDKNLDDSTYLKKNPKIRNNLKKALDNLSGTAFSLQQLLFDLDSAVLQRNYNFAKDIKNSDVQFILQSKYLKLYADSAKEHGWPMISVQAVQQAKDDSTLQMTAFERTTSTYRDSWGNEKSNPTKEQQSVTTLNYLCVVGKPRPSPETKFPWNWVPLEAVNQESGVVSISRNTLADVIIKKLTPQIAAMCYVPKINSDTVGGFTINTLDAKDVKLEVNDRNGSFISYGHVANDYGKVTYTRSNGQSTSHIIDFLATLNFKLHVYRDYITMYRAVVIRVMHDTEEPSAPAKAYHGLQGRPTVCRELNTTYNLAIDEFGVLQLVKADEDYKVEDDSWTDGGDAEISSDGHDDIAFRKEVYLKTFDKIADMHLGDLHQLQLGLAHNFVFPGAKVFAYKNPRFSPYRDLVCDITYVDPTQVSQSQPQQAVKEVEHQAKAVADEQPAQGHVLGSPVIGTKGKLTASTELMQNYIQGEVVSHTGKFEALQTGDGHTLLFSVDPSGVFNAIEEQSGTSHTGWKVHDISTAMIQQQFAGRGEKIGVRTFDVGHSALDGTIGLMMAVSIDGGGDHLFLSLGNPRSDTSWLANPTWTNIPFDAKSEYAQNISIAGTMFAETWGKK